MMTTLMRAASVTWVAATLTHAFTVPSNFVTSRNSVSLFQSSTENEATKSVLERLPDSAVEVTLTVPGSATQGAYDKACGELSKSINIPGFRKGARIPPKVLEQSMAAKGGRTKLREEAINSLLGQLIEPALKDEHGLEPIGQPKLKVPIEELAKEFEPGETMSLKVQCDVWPDITWKGGDKPYLGLKAGYKRKPFNQERLDKALNDLKDRYATLEPMEAGASLAMGDACVVNMEGFMANDDGSKGEPLPNVASGDNVEVILGSGRYMEGLVEGLVGAKVGDVCTVSVSFPEKLKDKSLAGKKAVFEVTVKEASHRSLPEVTDEFAAKVREGLTAESLVAELTKAVDQEDSKEFVGARNAALSKALSEVIDVDVPDTLVTNQAREKFAVMMTEMRDMGTSDEEIKQQISGENFLKYKDIVKDDIVRDFRVSMATDEIARIEGLDVPDYQIQEQLEAIKKDAEGSTEEFDEAMIRPKVEATMMRQAVMDFLAENADLDVEYTDEPEFDEAMMERLAQESLEREEKLVTEE